MRPLLPVLLASGLFLASAASLRAAAPQLLSASSSENPSLGPGNAADGDIRTRWASRFSDPQWVRMDFDSPGEISGLVLRWEAAYAKSYEVQVSNDGSSWKTVYSERGGEGGTDDVTFRKVRAQSLRIFCRRRGTTWGYSLYEIELKGSAESPTFQASSQIEGHGPDNAMDGDPATEWRSGPGSPQNLAVDLRRVKEIGGLDILWGRDYSPAYSLDASVDGKAWKNLWRGKGKRGGRARHYFPAARARHLRLASTEDCCRAGIAIKEMSLKGADKAASPLKLFQLAAEESFPGEYPRWLSGEQSFWTVIGADGGAGAESLLGEDGTLEPHEKGFSVTPFLFLDGRLVASRDCRLSQALEKGHLPLPKVLWDCGGGLHLDVTAACGAEPERSGARARYAVHNRTGRDLKGKLFLAIRPLQVNPPWQFGGTGDIRMVRAIPGKKTEIRVNERERILSAARPDGFGARGFGDGDIVVSLREGRLPSSRRVQSQDGTASAALEYSFHLRPGEEKRVDLHFPRDGEDPGGETFDSVFSSAVRHWDGRLGGFRFRLPDPALLDAVRANLAYLLIHRDGPALQPGSRNYQKSWMRDGSEMAQALLQAGLADEAKEYVEWISAKQGADGWVPFLLERGSVPAFAKDWTEYDSQGQFVHAVLQVYLYTGDRGFLQRQMPAVVSALKFLENLRKKGPASSRGILPPSNSHEGYFPAVHSYWDDFWALKGWKDGRTMAAALGRKDLAGWMSREEDALRSSLRKSIRRVMADKGLETIPASAEKADFDPNATASAVAACGELEHLPRRALERTFDLYYEGFLNRLGPGWTGSYTPYELRAVPALLLLDRKKEAKKVLEFFMSRMNPEGWRGLPEVLFGEPRHGQYIGDMPHGWIGAEFILAARSLFAYEKGGKLVLGHGIGEDWLGPEGLDSGVLRTEFGTVEYSIEKKEGLTVRVRGDAHPPEGFLFKPPLEEPVRRVTVNGKKWRSFSEDGVVFPTLPAEIEIGY